MVPVPLLVGIVLPQIGANLAQQALKDFRAALASEKKASIVRLFARVEDAPALIEMAENRGGLKNIKADVFPTPPGWEKGSGYWAIFHTFQDIEDEHDRVYRLIPADGGMKLGEEIPETDLGGWKVASAKTLAEITPGLRRVRVVVEEKFGTAGSRAPLLRLNDIYNVSSLMWGNSTLKVVTSSSDKVATVTSGQALRVGSLLIPWTASPVAVADFRYSGIVDQRGADHINDKVAYLSAWWIPNIGRLPFDSSVAVAAPQDWVVRSEGGEVVDRKKLPTGGQQLVSYRSKFPISYPKVIAGKYRVGAVKESNGRTFTSYVLEPSDKARAQKEVDRMADAAAFYDKTLVPFPFKSYECFEAEDYYGIESYSYTLLAPSIGPRYVAHEMGHTYFGGLVPCSYTKDSWNEGLTTYVDDVLTGRNVDKPLDRGLNSLNIRKPLNAMRVAHADDGQSYWRGAYVMKMLEHEIGLEKTLQGLRLLINGRVGKDTSWGDLRGYFEKASGKELSWFWEQWVDVGDFPDMQLMAAESAKDEKGFATKVLFGVSKPYIMRFVLRLTDGTHVKEEEITSNSTRATMVLKSDFRPTEAEIVIHGYALVHDKGLKLAVDKIG